MTISGFFDESGKFHDQKVISIGCVAAFNQHVDDFAYHWGHLLALNGLEELTAKRALNYRRPLSNKVSAIGVRERIDALLPFISCIRKYLEVIVGCAVDVREYKKLPPHFFQVYGKDPSYMAFVRVILEVCNFTPDGDRIVLVCDEDPETTIPFYSLYKRIKKEIPEIRRKMNAISFCDDNAVFGVQAADLVASLIRLDAVRRLVRKQYDYLELFQAMTAPPEKNERLWFAGIATANKKTIRKVADETLADLKKRKLIV